MSPRELGLSNSWGKKKEVGEGEAIQVMPTVTHFQVKSSQSVKMRSVSSLLLPSLPFWLRQREREIFHKSPRKVFTAQSEKLVKGKKVRALVLTPAKDYYFFTHDMSVSIGF